MTTHDEQTKHDTAFVLAMRLADMPDSMVEPEDVEFYSAEQLYDFLEEEHNRFWNGERWEYDG